MKTEIQAIDDRIRLLNNYIREQSNVLVAANANIATLKLKLDWAERDRGEALERDERRTAELKALAAQLPSARPGAPNPINPEPA